MSWSSRKKKEDIFCTVYVVRRELFLFFLIFFNCVSPQLYSVLNIRISEYTYFCIEIEYHSIHNFTYQKTLLHILILLVSKSSKAFSVSKLRITIYIGELLSRIGRDSVTGS